jgi:hypothetical protein
MGVVFFYHETVRQKPKPRPKDQLIYEEFLLNWVKNVTTLILEVKSKTHSYSLYSLYICTR